MNLGKLLGGYRTSMKRKGGKTYQKWLEMVQQTSSANQHMSDLVNYEVNHGVIDFSNSENVKVASKKPPEQDITEKVSLLDAINGLVETMGAMNTRHATETIELTNKLGIEPLQQELQSLREQRKQYLSALDAEEIEYQKVAAERRKQEKLVQENADKLQGMNEDLAKVRAQLITAQSKTPYVSTPTVNNVPIRAEADDVFSKERTPSRKEQKRVKGRFAKSTDKGEA